MADYRFFQDMIEAIRGVGLASQQVILDAVLNNDGAGSGIDADMIHGVAPPHLSRLGYAALADNVGTTKLVAGGGYTKMSYDIFTTNYPAKFDVQSDRITVKVSGLYLVNLNLQADKVLGWQGKGEARINGTPLNVLTFDAGLADYGNKAIYSGASSRILYVNANEYIEVWGISYTNNLKTVSVTERNEIWVIPLGNTGTIPFIV